VIRTASTIPAKPHRIDETFGIGPCLASATWIAPTPRRGGGAKAVGLGGGGAQPIDRLGPRRQTTRGRFRARCGPEPAPSAMARSCELLFDLIGQLADTCDRLGRGSCR